MTARRKTIGRLIAAASVAWLPGLRAQRMHHVAALFHGPERAMAGRYAALRAGLRGHGYEEGRNLRVSVRWNDGDLERLPDLAADLLRGRPDVVAAAPVLAAAAVQQLSRSVPTVLMWGAGMVKIGLVQSFARPGTNVTGLETQSEDLIPKQLELLKTVAPRIARVALLNTGRYLFHAEAWRVATNTARALKLTLVDVRVEAPADLTRLETRCGKDGCDALYVMPDPILINWRPQIIDAAERLRLPAMYHQPEYVFEGGLICYTANIDDMCRRAASYVDKILRGAKPSDLPIELPTKFELVINVRTATALGLTISQALRLRADRLIE